MNEPSPVVELARRMGEARRFLKAQHGRMPEIIWYLRTSGLSERQTAELLYMDERDVRRAFALVAQLTAPGTSRGDRMAALEELHRRTPAVLPKPRTNQR